MSELFVLSPDQFLINSHPVSSPAGSKIVIEEIHNNSGGVVIASLSFDAQGTPIGQVGVHASCHGQVVSQGYVLCDPGHKFTLDCAANSFDCR